MPASCDAEPHPGLAEESPEIDDPGERDDVAGVLGVERHRALLADPALELVGRFRIDEHAQRLTAGEADLDANELSHATPPPRERRGRNPGGRTRPRARRDPRVARRRRA